MTKGVWMCALVAAGACGGRSDSKADSARPSDSASASSATSPAVTPAATSSPADTTSRGAAPPPPAPRPAPGAKSPQPSPPAGKAEPVDTVRGIIAVVGTDRDKQVIIRPASGAPSITLVGPDAVLAGRAAGADVWVSGPKTDRRMTVNAFAVRTVDGIAAVDGELTLDGQKLVLVAQNGRRYTIANPPNALKEQVGGRVWVSGNLDQGPVAFGIIKPKP